MKRLLFVASIAAMSCSCSKRDNYKDISSTGIDYPACSNAPVQQKIFLDHDYAIDVTDDSIYLYTEDNKLVGVAKLEGELEQLIILDNE